MRKSAGERAGRRARDASAVEQAREGAPASARGQVEIAGREDEAEARSRPEQEHRAARVIGAVAAGGDERSEPARSRWLCRWRMWKRLDVDVDGQPPCRLPAASVPKAVRPPLESQPRAGRAAEHLEPDALHHLPDPGRAGGLMHAIPSRAWFDWANMPRAERGDDDEEQPYQGQ